MLVSWAAAGLVCIGPDDRAAAAAVAAATPLAEATPLIVSFPLDRRRTSDVLRGRDLPPDLLDLQALPFPVTGSRLAGYRDSLTQAGQDWDEVRIAVVERNQRELGKEAAAALLETLDGSGPVVMLAMSDELALGAHAMLDRTQREVTLTGWDGSREATASGIWSVSASLREQGRACARAALSRRLEARQVPWSVVAPEKQ